MLKQTSKEADLIFHDCKIDPFHDCKIDHVIIFSLARDSKTSRVLNSLQYNCSSLFLLAGKFSALKKETQLKVNAVGYY
jgi:hypothetical protein